MAWGTPLPDPDVARTVGRVLRLAAGLTFLNICLLVMNLASASSRGQLMAAMLIGMIGLAIPFCGRYGAVNHDAGCLCMFCAGNWCCFILSFLTIAWLVLYTINCHTSDWTDGTCTTVNRAMLVVDIVATLCTLCVSSAAGFYGNKLYIIPGFAGEAYEQETASRVSRPLPPLGVRAERTQAIDANAAAAARAEWAARPADPPPRPPPPPANMV
jgi:hypothetical protein